MARTNVVVPDELLEAARAEDLNVSAVVRAALTGELDRRARRRALYQWLDELDAELGEPSDNERAAAAKWADKVVGPSATDGQLGQRAAAPR